MAKGKRSKALPVELRHEEEIERVQQLADAAEQIVKIVCGILILLFAWLQFSPEDLRLLTTENSSSLVFRLAMALYFASWSIGAIEDIRDQRDALVVATNKGKPTRTGVGLIVAIGAMFGLLCVLRTKPQFAWAMAGMLVLNVVAWRYYVSKIMRGMINSSRAVFLNSDEYFRLEKVNNIERYLCGDWQRRRFIIGAALVVVMGALLYPGVAELIAGYFSEVQPHVLQSVGILAFVVIFEGIIWYHRVQTRVSRKQLDRMKKEYNLYKKG